MRKMFLLVASILVLALTVSIAYAADPARVDLNGELVNELTQWTAGGTANAPYFWDKYSEGAGGGYAGTFETGSSANAYVFRYEDESAYTTTTGTGGHGILLGASGGIGKYGIKQTYSNATSGKLYWFLGGHKYNTADGLPPTRPYLDYGIENGLGISNGTVQSGNLKTSSGSVNGLMGNAMFYSAVIASSSDITYHIGQNEKTQANQINSYFDGLRVWEFDISAKQSLVNGDFSSTHNLNATNYNARITTPPGPDMETVIPEGWAPMGSSAGQINRYFLATDGARGNVFAMDQYKSQGRMFAMQRVNMGAGIYSLSADLKTWGLTEGDARIGIDFTGGTDPKAASVSWTSALTATQTWDTRTLSGNAGANGITIWLASGNAGSARGGGSGMSYFDNISLNYVATPEPSSMLALASGLIGMAGFVVRRRK